ncbi:uncharacterized protein [Misgurnus anguillicaudatus]|uniref:uncharacterized protein n=1 Tax=Misgurnus anguillicaudatus TaxID=75329 RepID=UPI003CCFACB4
MSTWLEVTDVILRALPSLSSDILEQIVSNLQQCGLQCKDDLKYVQQDDLKDLLPVIQVRKLLEMFKAETEMVTLNLEVGPGPSACPSSSSLSSEAHGLSGLASHSETARPSLNTTHVSGISKMWPETFQVPWDKMPPEIRSAISTGKRPKPAERRQMVRILVDEMRKLELSPTRAQCLTVCKKIVREYPKTFGDTFPSGLLIGEGYTSLLLQVKARVENLNRDSSFVMHRAKPNTGCKRGPSDIYGCVRFEPQPPPEETADTLECKRQRLLDIYSHEGNVGVEKAEVKTLMESSFSLLRQQINSTPAPSVADIRSHWPYLFNQKSICTHFKMLTDIDVLNAFEMSMKECEKPMIEYFKSRSKNENMKTVLSQADNTEMAHLLIRLLMSHFQEHEDGLVLHADVAASASDVEKTLSLPASPRLILLGMEGQANPVRWMISLEGRIICECVQSTFLTAVATVFAVYYVFNLQYQEEASCTLEFLQRRFIRINPERGSKTCKGKVLSKKTGKVVNKKSATVNPKVASLLKNLMDFEWDFI